MTTNLTLEGSMVAIVTPFSNGQIDFDTFGKLIDFQIDNGTQGIIPCGTTGESPTLNNEEHFKVIEFTIDRVAGRVPVIAGTGSNCTEEAIHMTSLAKKAGADACLIVNPYYNKPTQHGMFEHMKKIAEIELPIMLYNIPGRTGIELSVDTILKMYNEIDMVVAIKEATGKLDTCSQLAAACDITILSGDDSLTLPMCSVGAKGVISVVANLLPAELRKFTDAIASNDMAAARSQHQKLLPLFQSMLSLETNPIPVKAAMAMAGLIKNELRLPMTPLSQCHHAKLADMLKPFGIEGSL